MGLFSTRNSDGASALAESCNTISTRDFRDLQDRARRANPQPPLFSDESVADGHEQNRRYAKRGEN